MQPTASKKEQPLKWILRYFREAREELKKVTWPSKETTIQYSILVVSISLLLAIFIGVLDWNLNFGLEALIEFIN